VLPIVIVLVLVAAVVAAVFLLSGDDDSDPDPAPTTDEPADDTGGSEPPLDDPEALADPALADLTRSCSEGDMAACDDLWIGTEAGGVLEAYAETCGGQAPAGGNFGSCEEEFG
jgi:hypothetical protein